MQLLLEKGHRPAERVHTINTSHCASPADAADKDQIAIKEDVREGKDKPEYSFVTQGEATPSFTRIFYEMAKFKRISLFPVNVSMFCLLLCKLLFSVTVCILKGVIQE